MKLGKASVKYDARKPSVCYVNKKNANRIVNISGFPPLPIYTLDL